MTAAIQEEISRGWVQVWLGSGAGTVTPVIQRLLVHSLRIRNEGSKVTKKVLPLKQVTVQMSHDGSDPPVLGHRIVPGLLERFRSAVTSQRCQLTDARAAPHARLLP